MKREILERRAKRVLVKSGFIKDYYYIVKVLESYKRHPRKVLLLPAYSWGEERLRTVRDKILEKHSDDELLSCHIRSLCNSYIAQLCVVSNEVSNEMCRRHGAFGVWNLVGTQDDGHALK